MNPTSHCIALHCIALHCIASRATSGPSTIYNRHGEICRVRCQSHGRGQCWSVQTGDTIKQLRLKCDSSLQTCRCLVMLDTDETTVIACAFYQITTLVFIEVICVWICIWICILCFAVHGAWTIHSASILKFFGKIWNYGFQTTARKTRNAAQQLQIANPLFTFYSSTQLITMPHNDTTRAVAVVHNSSALAFVLHYLHSELPEKTTSLIDDMWSDPSCLMNWYKYLSSKVNCVESHMDIHNKFILSFMQEERRISGDADTDDECVSPDTIPMDDLL